MLDSSGSECLLRVHWGRGVYYFETKLCILRLPPALPESQKASTKTLHISAILAMVVFQYYKSAPA